MVLYLFIRFLVRIGIAIFFRNKTVNNRHYLPQKGPLILAVNHPNTLMDVLLAAANVDQRVGFLANAPLFENPTLRKLLNYLHAIPVYRQQDLKEGEVIDNRTSFSKCVEYLEKEGTIMIFPEGTSYSEMKLRKLKTGLARIAFEYEKKHEFNGNLTIVPIGLNYSDPLNFRSEVIMNYGEPLLLKDYAQAYKKDSIEAVHQLNDDLKNRFEQQLIILEDKPQEKLFKDLLSIQAKTSTQRDFATQFTLAEDIRELKNKKEATYRELEKLNTLFQQEKQSQKLSKHFSLFLSKDSVSSQIFKIVIGILLFPFFVFGLIVNYFPAYLSSKLPEKITKEFEYWAALKLTFGVILFPLWYLLLTFIAYLNIPLTGGQAIVFLIILVISGLFVITYRERWQYLKNVFRLKRLQKKKVDVISQLQEWAKRMQELLIRNIS